MRRLTFFLLPFSLFLLFIGCDSSDPDPDPIAVDSISGTWRGEVPSLNVMVSLAPTGRPRWLQIRSVSFRLP